MKGRVIFTLVLPLLVGISSLGIFLIEGEPESPFASLFNSLWWTVVTFTTVGYGDMSPVTVPGRTFGLFILATGVLINSIIISMISNWFFALKSSRSAGLKPVSANEHILICSDSPVFIQSLLDENHRFVKEGRAVIISPLTQHPLLGTSYEKIPWVHGDAYRVGILKKASAPLAEIAYVAFKDDADTVMTVMQLEVLSPGGRIKTMAQYQIRDYQAHLMNVGCDYAIKTYDVYVPLMVQACISQGAPVWVRDVILRLTGMPSLKRKGPLGEGKETTWLQHLIDSKRQLGETPLGLIDTSGQLLVNPPANRLLLASDLVLTMVPPKPGDLGDHEQQAIPIQGFESIKKEGHIIICSDNAPFIDRVLSELELAGIFSEIIVLSPLKAFPDKVHVPELTWVQASSFSDFGIGHTHPTKARIAFIDHQRDSHTLMAVLRLESLTNGDIFTVASYKEPDFDERLIGVGCDYCVNVDELIAPIMSQNAVHPGVGMLIEQIISHKPESQSLFVLTLTEQWEACSWIDSTAKLKETDEILPLALIRAGDNRLMVSPHPEVTVNPGDRMILITQADAKFEQAYFESYHL
ncbi:MAG: ion channel [bacterium]|nr:ion channel [bacterium]